MRYIYKKQQTIKGQRVTMRECDCGVARQERLDGKRAHMAWRPVDHSSSNPNEYYCTGTNLTIYL